MSVIMRMVLDILAQILRTLWAHKLRSFLTMFGVAWGVGSLLLLVGLGEGFRSGNKRALAEFGESTNLQTNLIQRVNNAGLLDVGPMPT